MRFDPGDFEKSGRRHYIMVVKMRKPEPFRAAPQSVDSLPGFDVKMKKLMLSGKIHTARLTDCQIDYEGSLEIDPELLAEADILPYEKILVSNRANGARLETYAIPGEPGKRRFCLNGPAAKLGSPGDIVTIMAFSLIDTEEAKHWTPRVIVLDENNEIKLRKGEHNL